MSYDAILIGGSAGSITVLKKILSSIKAPLKVPIIIVLHLPEDAVNLEDLFSYFTDIQISEAVDKEKINSNRIYTAPAAYHLEIEENFVFSLSLEEKVNYSRPSIDLLFISAAEAFKGNLVGILLTGANADGAIGLERIEALGGEVIIQSPETAYMKEMPMSGIRKTKRAKVLTINEIVDYINQLNY